MLDTMRHINELPYEVLFMILDCFNLNSPNYRSAYRGLTAPLFDAMRVCKRWLCVVSNLIRPWARKSAEFIIRSFREEFSLGYYEAWASEYWKDPSRPQIIVLSREEILIRTLRNKLAEVEEELRIIKYVKAKNKEEW